MSVDDYFYHYKAPREEYTSIVVSKGAKVLVQETPEIVSSRLAEFGLKLGTLTHPNLQCEIFFSGKNYFYSYYSKNHKSTQVIGLGGAFFPCVELDTQVRAQLGQGVE